MANTMSAYSASSALTIMVAPPRGSMKLSEDGVSTGVSSSVALAPVVASLVDAPTLAGGGAWVLVPPWLPMARTQGRRTTDAKVTSLAFCAESPNFCPCWHVTF